MKIIKHNGGYLLDPRLLGRIEFLIEYLKTSMDSGLDDESTKFVLKRVLDGFSEMPPVAVYTAESMQVEKTE